MSKLQGNPIKKSLLIFAIILYIFPLYTAAEIRSFSYEEDEYPGQLNVRDLRAYDDGTVVVIITRNETTTGSCFYKMLSLRIIHPNGIVDKKNSDLERLGIQPCYFQNEMGFIEFLNYHLIGEDYILITYYNTTDPNEIYTYEEWGMIVDFDNKEYDRINFGLIFDNTTNQLTLDSKIKLNINNRDGFLRLARLRNSMVWQQYRIEYDGKFTRLTEGILGFSSLIVSIISTVAGGYNIVYANTTNNFTETDPGQLMVLPIGYNQTSYPPLLLYQTPLPSLTFLALTCDTSVLIGQACVLTISQKGPAGLPPDQKFFVKVDFLSSGPVTDLTIINLFPDVVNINNNQDIILTLNGLPFGGYLLTIFFNVDQNNHYINGLLFNTEKPGLRFPESTVPTNSKGVYQVLPHNNSLLVAQTATSNFWQFQIIDLPKFAGDRDVYSNLNVEATSPAINDKISGHYIREISVNFFRPVEINHGNLMIYQVMDDRSLNLRQSIPSVLCSIENDGKTVTARVLESTFSVSNGKYFIKMDNNFVRDKEYKEPCLGIKEHVWSFETEERIDIFALSVVAGSSLRLTSEGTKVFDNLSPRERHEFFNKLLDELSSSVPVERSRLTTNMKVQPDNEARAKKYLISIGILETRDEFNNSVASILNYIDIMVKNKDQSPIGSGQVTRYLDESYGFKFLSLWDAYRARFISLYSIFGFLIALFIFTQIRYGGTGIVSTSIVILQLCLITPQWLLDISFSIYTKNVHTFYIPSVVFVILPIAINTILAFHIIIQEMANPKFYLWFTRNKTKIKTEKQSGNKIITAIFTVLASADTSILTFLLVFGAPLSKSAQSTIFWGSFLNIFTRYVPQIIIQSLYMIYDTNPIYFNLIQLLALIFSIVSSPLTILHKLFQATNHMRDRNVFKYIPNNKDDFERPNIDKIQ